MDKSMSILIPARLKSMRLNIPGVVLLVAIQAVRHSSILKFRRPVVIKL